MTKKSNIKRLTIRGVARYGSVEEEVVITATKELANAVFPKVFKSLVLDGRRQRNVLVQRLVENTTNLLIKYLN
jgi:hypothetical protein